MDEDNISHFPEKNNLGITKNSSGITFIAMAANVYNVLLLSCMWPDVEKNFNVN